MITIPNEILETARKHGTKAPIVAKWMRGRLAEAGISTDASPADWPQEIWDAYESLCEAHAPGACKGSAVRLFQKLGIHGDD